MAFKDRMQALMPHYMQEHADVMNDPSKGAEDQQRWLAENRASFEQA